MSTEILFATRDSKATDVRPQDGASASIEEPSELDTQTSSINTQLVHLPCIITGLSERMEADELQAIRAARAQQLKQESESAQSSQGTAGQSEEVQGNNAEDARRDILAALLESAARERRLLP